MASLDRAPVLVMTTGASAVIAGGQVAGWVSGNPANLAGATLVSGGVVFDLGPNWDQYTLISINANPTGASVGINVQPSGSDTSSYNSDRRLNAAYSNAAASIYMTVTTASGSQAQLARPSGRYVACIVSNNDPTNALGATTKITLTAYPA